MLWSGGTQGLDRPGPSRVGHQHMGVPVLKVRGLGVRAPVPRECPVSDLDVGGQPWGSSECPLTLRIFLLLQTVEEGCLEHGGLTFLPREPRLWSGGPLFGQWGVISGPWRSVRAEAGACRGF